MPLYAYRCLNEEHEFEARQRMSDDPLTECVVCGGPVRRVINQVGIVFKGSGFYVTDSKGSNSAGVTTNGTTDGAASKEAKSESSTPPTPAATNENGEGKAAVKKAEKSKVAT